MNATIIYKRVQGFVIKTDNIEYFKRSTENSNLKFVLVQMNSEIHAYKGSSKIRENEHYKKSKQGFKEFFVPNKSVF